MSIYAYNSIQWLLVGMKYSSWLINDSWFMEEGGQVGLSWKMEMWHSKHLWLTPIGLEMFLSFSQLNSCSSQMTDIYHWRLWNLFILVLYWHLVRFCVIKFPFAKVLSFSQSDRCFFKNLRIKFLTGIVIDY